MENGTSPEPDDAQLQCWESIASDGSFEDALESLGHIVKLLDNGALSLESSIRCFEIGTNLSRRCTSLLENAKLRISTIEAEGLLRDEFDMENDE